MMTNELQLDLHRALGRRGLLTTAGLATFAALGTGLVPGTASAAPVGDGDILDFALNLEYLEAEFYLRAATGSDLPGNQIGGTATQGAVTGGHKVPFKTKALWEYANEIAEYEANHERFLRSASGAGAVARPRIDLDRLSPRPRGRRGWSAPARNSTPSPMKPTSCSPRSFSRTSVSSPTRVPRGCSTTRTC
jgi:hypothetical protein